MLHTFAVPVKPHVAKFLLHHLGQGYKLSQLDAFGRHLRLLLQQKNTRTQWDGHLARYTATFSVSVDGNLMLQKRLRVMTSKTIIDFNNHCEGIIKTEMYGLLENRGFLGLSQYGVIQQFRAKYDFQDEDISHDTLKKAWQRYAKEDKPAPGQVKSVTVCPPLLPSLATDLQQRLAA